MNYRNLVSTLFAVFLVCTIAFSPVPATQAQTPRKGTTQYPWTTDAGNVQHTGFNNGPAPNTPHLLWKKHLPQAGGASSFLMSIAQGLVYIGEYIQGGVYALNQSTGEIVWQWNNTRHTAYSPRYMDGMIFTTQADYPGTVIVEPGVGSYIPNHIVALNATTGAEIWKADYQGTGVPGCFPYKGKVYVGNSKYNFTTGVTTYGPGYAVLDAKTGALLRILPYAGIGQRPTFDGDNMYVLNGQTLYSININTYNVNWNVTVPQAGTLMAGYGSIYVIASKPSRIEQSTGLNAWTGIPGYEPNLGLPAPIMPMSVSYNKVFLVAPKLTATQSSTIQTGSTIYAIDAFTAANPLNIYWAHDISNPIAGFVGVYSGGVADGKLYVGDYTGVVHCIAVQTGNELWSFSTGDILQGYVAIADGKVYVAGRDAYCFGDAPTSSMSLSAPSSVLVGQSLTLTGKMTDAAGAGIAGASVTLSSRASFTPVIEWSHFATVTTGADGSFSYTMAMPNEGYYDFNAGYCEPSIGGYTTSNATVTVRATVQTPTPVDLGPVTDKVSSLESTVSTLQTYLIVIAVLLVVVVIVIAAAWMWPKKTRI
jgi:outer membrane protein assembly factor BamB